MAQSLARFPSGPNGLCRAMGCAAPDERFAGCFEAEAFEAAAHVDPRAALPLKAARSTWVALTLLVVAGAVFTLRYGVLRTFDLRPPIAEVRFDTLTGAPEPVRRQLAKSTRPGDLPAPFSLDLEGERSGIGKSDGSKDTDRHGPGRRPGISY